MMISEHFKVHPRHYQLFSLLIIYRWGSLIPPLWGLITFRQIHQETYLPIVLFLIAVSFTLFTTAFYKPIIRILLRYPILLGVDLIVSIVFLVVDNGNSNLYYLYLISPILAGGFFFQVRGKSF